MLMDVVVGKATLRNQFPPTVEEFAEAFRFSLGFMSPCYLMVLDHGVSLRFGWMAIFCDRAGGAHAARRWCNGVTSFSSVDPGRARDFVLRFSGMDRLEVVAASDDTDMLDGGVSSILWRDNGVDLRVWADCRLESNPSIVNDATGILDLSEEEWMALVGTLS